MQLITGYENKTSRIEIVPLIDVVFLLLVVFIYAMVTMTVYRGLRVRLAIGDGTQEELKTIVIAIAEDNSLWIDGRIVSMRDAVGMAASRTAEQDNPVLLSGAQGADLGVAIELLSELRKVNVTSVSFQVRKENEP